MACPAREVVSVFRGAGQHPQISSCPAPKLPGPKLPAPKLPGPRTQGTEWQGLRQIL